MSENEMRDGFRQLGENLQRAVNAAWQSSERKRLQQELIEGLQDLEKAFEDFGTRLNQSEQGQRMKADLEQLSEKVRKGELQDKAHAGVVAALQKANEEILKLLQRWDLDDK